MVQSAIHKGLLVDFNAILRSLPLGHKGDAVIALVKDPKRMQAALAAVSKLIGEIPDPAAQGKIGPDLGQ